MTATVFVFYTFAKSGEWRYGKLPKGWEWTGAGSTSPICPKGMRKLKKQEYEREEQFNGPLKTRKQMREYLDRYFARLKKRGIVKKYKIRNSYLP